MLKFLFLLQREPYEFDMKWPASLMIKAASKLTMFGNCIAGSEKIGLITSGVSCDEQSTNQIRDNEVNHKVFFIKLIVL